MHISSHSQTFSIEFCENKVLVTPVFKSDGKIFYHTVGHTVLFTSETFEL